MNQILAVIIALSIIMLSGYALATLSSAAGPLIDNDTRILVHYGDNIFEGDLVKISWGLFCGKEIRKCRISFHDDKGKRQSFMFNVKNQKEIYNIEKKNGYYLINASVSDHYQGLDIISVLKIL
ncbi:MAG: hypothetical protein PHW52_01495 [Candidatus Pacebacteria bacterium]|nr:hypothetical protein [Candidatus Paceibacterota bacterium]